MDGVHVETEADDDSDEAPLPTIDDEIAPALFGGDDKETGTDAEEDAAVNDQIAGFFDDEEPVEAASSAESDSQTPEDIEARLDSFFGEDVEETPAFDESEADEIEAEADSLFGEPEQQMEQESEPGAIGDDSEEDIASEIDSFLGEEDGSEQDLFRAVPEDEDHEESLAVLGDTTETDTEILETEIEPENSAAFSMAEDGDATRFELAGEEEITFEPAENDDAEEDLPVAVLEGDESAVDDDLSSFGSGSDEQDFFAAIDERIDEPGEFQMEILDETDEFDGSTVAVQPEVDSEESTVEEEKLFASDAENEEEQEPFTFSGEDDLVHLRDGIASLGVEINESITDGILAEINGLRHRMMTRPIEKTFLQLISTIVQHIGQYGYEASAESHGLLLSVFDKLELVQNEAIQADQAQEVLLAETSKVLLWQQKMLDRQAVKKGDQLTFLDPVRTDEKEGDGEAEGLTFGQQTKETAESLESLEDEDFTAVFEPVEEDVSETLPEMVSDGEEIGQSIADIESGDAAIRADDSLPGGKKTSLKS